MTLLLSQVNSLASNYSLASGHGNRLAAQLSGESQCSRDGSQGLNQGLQGLQPNNNQGLGGLGLGLQQASNQGLGVPSLHHPPRTPPLYEEAMGVQEGSTRGGVNNSRGSRLQAAVQAPSFTSHNNHSWGCAPLSPANVSSQQTSVPKTSPKTRRFYKSTAV